MKTPDLVLELLYDRLEESFPLDELASRAGLSARRLEQALEALRQRGHRIERTPYGLCLPRPVRLDAHLIERNLGTRRIGRNVICFDEVGSTNDVAFDSARQRGSDGLVVLAESQTRGRGRQGHPWISPPGANVLASCLLVDAQERLWHESLTVAAGLAVAEGIDDACGLRCGLKWPNDVLADDAKLAGVLVEIRKVAGRRCVVIGLGINVSAAPGRVQVDAPATSIARQVGHPVERTAVVQGVLRRLEYWVQCVERSGPWPKRSARAALGGGLLELHDKWLSRCAMLNRRIEVSCGGRTYAGRILDVSPLSGLTLLCDDGPQVHLPAKNATVIK